MSDSQIMIVAAEASSSLYAQRLLEHWRAEGRHIKAFGVGSQAMVNLGFEALGRSEEMAVVGLQEVLAHFSQIRSVFYSLIEECQKRKPRVVLLLDYPDFNLRLCKKLKSLGIPVVYYISPQLWAWRTSRVELIKKFVDRMLVVFPFEKDFYKSHNVAVDFVGHPLLDEIAQQKWTAEMRQVHRKRFGIGNTETLVGLMPGSRRSELKHNLAVQLQTAEVLSRKNPKLRFAWLVAPGFDLEFAKSLLPPHMSASVQLIQSEPFAMIQLCDAIVTASGTATMMVGLAEVPMVIMYKMNWLTASLAKWLVKSVKYFGMVNLISNEEIVPELFQDEASANNLAREVESLLDKNVAEQVRTNLQRLPGLLGGGGATVNVAKILNRYVEA